MLLLCAAVGAAVAVAVVGFAFAFCCFFFNAKSLKQLSFPAKAERENDLRHIPTYQLLERSENETQAKLQNKLGWICWIVQKLASFYQG